MTYGRHNVSVDRDRCVHLGKVVSRFSQDEFNFVDGCVGGGERRWDKSEHIESLLIIAIGEHPLIQNCPSIMPPLKTTLMLDACVILKMYS